jgi:YesN/AraC family two-component response regulator
MANPKILLIEDEIRSQDLFVFCLQAEGYETLTANDGSTGLQIAIQQLPDLVLCDIMMPQLNGYEVLKKLRQNNTTAIIPFIFLSAKASKSELRKGMNLGADDYLTKPITAEELIEAIEARLKKHSLTDNSYAFKEKTLVAEESISTSDQTAESFFPCLPHLEQVFSFIEANYSQGITLNDVAQAVGYSPAYLTNLVGKQTGKTINRWIIERRMVAACYLLQETDKSIENIAREIGYQDPCHFSRQFRQHWQTTPQKWRNQML